MKSLSTPPKGRSATKSSQSNTSKSNTGKPSATTSRSGAQASGTSVPAFETPVQFVKGVGPRLGIVFQHREIETVRDLLTFFPRTYEDRTKIKTVGEVTEGARATLSVQVVGSRSIPLRSGKRMFEVRCVDAQGTPLAFKYFNLPRGMDQKFKPGIQLIATGLVKRYQGRLEMAHPEINWNVSASIPQNLPSLSNPGEPAPEADRDYGRIVPIYTEIEGVPTRSLRKILWEAVQKYADTMPEDLPRGLLDLHGLPRLGEAIRAIHFPPETADISRMAEFRTPNHLRLIYEEFLKFELVILQHRRTLNSEAALPVPETTGLAASSDLEKRLPFPLTGDQRRCIAEILKDLSTPHPMNRLIQGDVGSGKTVVALLTASAILADGGQAAMMAPTEILAEQHYKTATKLLGGKLNTRILTGKTPAGERRETLARLAAGEPLLLIGTHALIEEPVKFQSLRYVMIDEQHRFGVEQRRILREKGRLERPGEKPCFPHSLSLSATPIPRTLALTAYGDLTVSSVKEMPPGRSPVKTKVIRGEARSSAYEFIRSQIAEGRQAFFIYPLVNESEAEGFTSLKSATQEAERLQREVFPEFRVGLLHGQIKGEEKQKIMDAFSRNEIQILVSTTVVEVGVDVPNATVMAVEHCERFGLSQLHQLRGRVGRGTHASHCFLFTKNNPHETTNLRLEVLEETTDGFKIAEADLEIRGPGEFLGTRQSGGLPFRIANLVRDQEWLLKAREDAERILHDDPLFERPENLPIRRYFTREGDQRLLHFGTA